VLVYCCGIYHVIAVLFDASWPVLFNWKKTLAKVDAVQRSLPYITSRLLMVLYAGIAYLAFFRTHELLNTGLGHSILVFISAFYVVRSVLQVKIFGVFGKANNLDVAHGDYGFPMNIGLSHQSKSNIFLAIFILGAMLPAMSLVLAG
jgi:hypothetical protein